MPPITNLEIAEDLRQEAKIADGSCPGVAFRLRRLADRLHKQGIAPEPADLGHCPCCACNPIDWPDDEIAPASAGAVFHVEAGRHGATLTINAVVDLDAIGEPVECIGEAIRPLFLASEGEVCVSLPRPT